jgi:hypothetical protein
MLQTPCIFLPPADPIRSSFSVDVFAPSRAPERTGQAATPSLFVFSGRLCRRPREMPPPFEGMPQGRGSNREVRPARASRAFPRLPARGAGLVARCLGGWSTSVPATRWEDPRGVVSAASAAFPAAAPPRPPLRSSRLRERGVRCARAAIARSTSPREIAAASLSGSSPPATPDRGTPEISMTTSGYAWDGRGSDIGPKPIDGFVT